MFKHIFIALTLTASSAVFAETNQIDLKLNATYKEAFKMLGNPLQKSQRAWLKFRDLDCNAQLPNFGTDPYFGDNFQNCIDQHNLIRIKQLEAMQAV